MSVFMQPLLTYEVTSTTNPYITLSNIPQGYTDLKLVMCFRRWDATNGDHYLQLNNDSSTNYSHTYIQGTGTGRYTSRLSGGIAFLAGQLVGTNTAANIHTTSEIYIPNYTSTTPKQILVEEHREERTTNGANVFAVAALYRGTAPVTSILCGYGFAQYSTINLYGILRQGV